MEVSKRTTSCNWCKVEQAKSEKDVKFNQNDAREPELMTNIDGCSPIIFT